MRPADGSTTMTHPHRALLETANAEMAAGNPQGFIDHCADDIRWEMVGEETIVGKDAVLAWARKTYAVAPPAFSADHWIIEGDWLAVRGEITVQDAERGAVHSKYCDLWRIEGGKLAELRAFAIEESKPES